MTDYRMRVLKDDELFQGHPRKVGIVWWSIKVGTLGTFGLMYNPMRVFSSRRVKL